MDLKQLHRNLVIVIFIVSLLQTLCNCMNVFYDDEDDDLPISRNSNRCPWIRNKLKNGRVKIRSRGRIAKFLCDPGFELAGKRFATCVRAQWNNPIPVCVAHSCYRLPDVRNGRVTETYRGGVKTYSCLPGYTLKGDATIYCDGKAWSSTPPACEVATTDPQTDCDFETPDLCGWSQDQTHDFDWKRNQFSTPSGHVGTGPSFDHTFGQGKAGFYLFMETSSPREVNDTTRLFSPVYSKEHSGGCFTFWYHMYGSSTGGLRVYVKPESHVFVELSPSWVLFGEQGNQWHRGNVTVPPQLNEGFQIVIEGIRGNSYVGDSAIDDVSLHSEDCESVRDLTNISEVWSDSCRGRCREQDNSTSCGCNDDCLDTKTCCIDFETICTKDTESEVSDTYEENTSPYTSTSVANTEKSESKSTPIELGRSEDESTTSVSIPTTNAELNHKVDSSSSVTFTTTSSTINPTTRITTIPTTVKMTSTPLPSSTSAATTSTLPTTSSSTVAYSTSSTPTPSTESQTTQKVTIPSPQVTVVTTSTTLASVSTSAATSTSASTSTQASTSTSTETPLTDSITSTFLNFQNKTSTMLPSTTQTSTLEPTTTRKTYNLRPRTSTTVIPRPVSKTSTTQLLVIPTIASTPGRTIPSTIKPPPPPIYIATLPNQHRYDHNFDDQVTSLTTLAYRSFERSTAGYEPKVHPTIPIRVPTTTTLNGYRKQLSSTELPSVSPRAALRPSTVTSGDHDAHASKAASAVPNGSKPAVTIVCVAVVVAATIAGGVFFFVRRRKAKMQSKFADDSEMRFLSENEVVEFSDSSALERINFNS